MQRNAINYLPSRRLGNGFCSAHYQYYQTIFSDVKRVTVGRWKTFGRCAKSLFN